MAEDLGEVVMGTRLESLNEEVARLEKQRAEAQGELLDAQSSMTKLRAAFGGGVRMPDAQYRRANENYVAGTKRLAEAQKRMALINAELRAKRIERSEKERIRYLSDQNKAMVDEFDVANKLSEPQMLLRRACSRLKAVLSQVPRKDGDTELVDVIEDYLRRHGIAL